MLTPRWVAVHLGVLLLVGGFLGLGWWQVTRARAGNLLSFGYAIEWPVFAAFVVWVWIVEMRKVLRPATDADSSSPAEPSPPADPSSPVDPRAKDVLGHTLTPGSTQSAGVGRRRLRNEAAYDDSDDPALAEYNHYLAWLNAHPWATPADYPGMPAPATKAEET